MKPETGCAFLITAETQNALKTFFNGCLLVAYMEGGRREWRRLADTWEIF